MALIKVPTSFNIEVEFEIPEFYKRLFSLLIDVLMEIVYLFIATKIMRAITENYDFTDDDSMYDLSAIGMLLILPVMVYHVVLEITMNGQSIGKKIMGIRVVNENGGRPSISQFLIRWLLRVSDLWILAILFILSTRGMAGSVETGFLLLAALAFLVTDIVLVVSSKKGQRIGDILAKTILIRISSKASIEETIFQEVEDSYTPSFPAIMQLSDRDINAIKSILETSRKKNDHSMAMAAADKIKNHLQIHSDLDPYTFLDVLLKDYNYLSVK
ncbi:MAG: RDD family protein [Chitinophagaceae bacterium]|nr:MAG: RDD family protein [Chitinophagaceae bacterium]